MQILCHDIQSYFVKDKSNYFNIFIRFYSIFTYRFVLHPASSKKNYFTVRHYFYFFDASLYHFPLSFEPRPLGPAFLERNIKKWLR